MLFRGSEYQNFSIQFTMTVIGLNLSDTHLEIVQHAETSKEMCNILVDMLEKYTLLNKLASRRLLYNAEMQNDAKLLNFCTRIRQLAASLKYVNSLIDEQEMEMSFFCGSPDNLDGLISAVDAHVEDSDTFTFKFVVSKCKQE